MEIDLLVIGGGINGCGVAADAAGRGLSVILCEKDDLAFATSSSSTKLIHGGLRYLEQYSFKLVRESLKEREVLMAKAPFLIRPVEFVMPYNKFIRPAWLIRIGLFLYDSLYLKRTLAGSKKLNLQKDPEGEPLKGDFQKGFSYSDCWVDDSRLVILNALAAKEKGARILTRTECTNVKRESDHWVIQLHDRLRDTSFSIKAKVIVNAAGPWATEVIKDITHLPTDSSLRLVQGSHIVVAKLYEGNQAYTLQNPDGRIVFVIPYRNRFTLIGTTDAPFEGDPNMAAITNAEINYLCGTVNSYFTKQISGYDIVWSYSGVRPLLDDHKKNPAKVSRDYHIELDSEKDQAPFLSIFGGKITTYRIVAEEVMNRLKEYFPEMGPDWTANEKLPGGDLDGLAFNDFLETLEKQYDWMPTHIMRRYAKIYGSLCHAFLSDCHSINDLGHYFGGGLYEREVLHLIQNEWAQKVDDILWRRTKTGLFLTDEEAKALKNYLAGK